jgi:hypothetical protein
MDDGAMPLLALAALTLSAAQLLDLATFVAMVRAVGPTAEANPLVAYLFGAFGFPMVAIAKVILVAVAMAIVAMLLGVRPHPRVAATVIATGIVVGIIGGISNSVVFAASGVRLLV